MSEVPAPGEASETTAATIEAADEPAVSASGASIRPVEDPDAHPPIRILGLRLRGVRRDYLVDFTDDRDVGRDLSLIVGEIATGKTTVLDFIDYCLGASSHPTHTEVTDNVRAAQLAIEILERPSGDDDQEPDQRQDDEQRDDGDGDRVGAGAHLARYVIERPVGGATATVMLFRGDHNRLDDSWYRRLTMTPADTDSLSQFLLRACGLDGLRVRQSPSKEDSSTSVLSFRDVMPLAFLAHTRIGSNDLVYEKNPHRTIKLRQVVDYLFDVSDQKFSDIAARIEELRDAYREAQAGLKTLRSFLVETGVRSEDDLRGAASRARARRALATEQLTQITQSLTASTEFAATTRTAYNDAAQAARELSAQIRERDTLLGRLSTLRSQYADDLHKIDLLAETQQLFDALSVTVCPACQNPLPEPVTIADGNCTLCHQSVIAPTPPQPSDASADSDVVDLSRERRNLRKRLRELGTLTDEIAVEVAELNTFLRQAQQALEQAQRNLDASTSAAVAPFITQRDQLTATIAGIDTELGTLRDHFRMRRQLLERAREAERVGAALTAARERRKALEQSQHDRDAVLAQLSGRFGELLATFHFPKLSEPFLDSSLIPHARGSRYDQLGSAGAMTLIALAWELAIFELSVEQGRSHPGFLMIDSPQKGLRQVSDGSMVSSDIASDAGSIVDRIYAHIASWIAAHPGRAQIIIVDNEPPASVDENDVAARYSGDPAAPPYGLIEDAVD